MNDHWSGKFLPLLVISVDIGYFPFYYFVVFVLCLYILLINISFALCIVGGRKVNFFFFFFFRRQSFGYILETLLEKYILENLLSMLDLFSISYGLVSYRE